MSDDGLSAIRYQPSAQRLHEAVEHAFDFSDVLDEGPMHFGGQVAEVMGEQELVFERWLSYGATEKSL